MAELMGKEIRCVAFDFGGVLAYFITRETVEKMAKLAQVPYEEFNRSIWAYRYELDLGEHPYHQYWGNVLRGCSSPVPLEKIEKELTHLDVTGFSRMNQKMLNWVKNLQENSYRTIIISNMSPETYQELVKEQPWLDSFDEAIISGLIKINKPDPRIYEAAIRKAGVEPSQILFLDDVERNIEGAKKMGIRAHLFSDTDALFAELEANYPTLPRQGLNDIDLPTSKDI